MTFIEVYRTAMRELGKGDQEIEERIRLNNLNVPMAAIRADTKPGREREAIKEMKGVIMKLEALSPEELSSLAKAVYKATAKFNESN